MLGSKVCQDSTEERKSTIKKVLMRNNGVTSFTDGFSGATFWLYFGEINMVSFVALLKMCTTASMFLCSFLQKYVADLDKHKLFKYGMYIESFTALFYTFANMVLITNPHVGVIFIFVSNTLLSVVRAFNSVQFEHVITYVVDENTPIHRSKLNADIKKVCTLWSSVGTFINFLYFLAVAREGITLKTAYEIALMSTTIMYTYDMYVSFIQYRLYKKYMQD